MSFFSWFRDFGFWGLGFRATGSGFRDQLDNFGFLRKGKARNQYVEL